MNVHIELVKKWLADPKSVSQEDLITNAGDATSDGSTDAWAAASASNAALADNANNAVYWINRYEELTK
jgi:hypothetical protein